MLIPTMTLEEVRKEIAKDFPILFRKANYVAVDLAKSLSKVEKIQGHTAFYEYTSKYKNKWIYRIHVTKKQNIISGMMLYHSGIGHVGIAVTQQGIVYHTGHFFQRYNERSNLHLHSLNDIIHSYMDHTTRFDFQMLDEIAPGIRKVFCRIESGVILGTLNSPLQLLKANTFLSREMLRGDQIELDKELMNDELNKYADTSGKLD